MSTDATPQIESSRPQRMLFRRRHRLGHKREFDAVYEAKVRKHRGSLTVFALPNELPHHRLGLSVPKRVGSAPQRNRVKRCLREAFRLLQEEIPKRNGHGYDFVVAVRPHDGLSEPEYRELLRVLFLQLDAEWAKRERREENTA
ncbi:MAG: ribonuclease P protein component [Phycisphaerales bacterium JB065]